MSKILTEEVFDEIVKEMDKSFSKKTSWDRNHPPVSPKVANVISKYYPDNCPYCGMTWKKCREGGKHE